MNILNETHPRSTETAIAEVLLQIETDETRRQAILQALENVNRKGFYIEAKAIVKLMKPVTWFPPMWAFLCGAISTGEGVLENWLVLVAGLILAGPLMCAMSQTMNDYFDREVDAINEPYRPIPSGQISKDASWIITFALIIVAFALSYWIHPYVLWISFAGVLMSHAYSGPPLRAKRNGWYGNLIVGLAYEGVAWLTGSFALTKGVPSSESIWLAIVFSLGAHGIMTLNDFKSVTGDKIRNVRSIPVQLGEKNAAILAAVVMNSAQAIAIAIVALKGAWIWAGAALLLLIAQQPMQRILIAQPKEKAVWYNAFGTLLYVMSMMIAAIGIR